MGNCYFKHNNEIVLTRDSSIENNLHNIRRNYVNYPERNTQAQVQEIDRLFLVILENNINANLFGKEISDLVDRINVSKMNIVSSSESTEDICSICLNTNPGSFCRLAKCKHYFHEYCINKYILMHKNICKVNCPYCRSELEII